ncbi:MAG TPA: cytochrome c oxidase accessory protein CcoG, partial [Alphaproteobacteria bacterium]|nr:cytochrome c oxidase accessory protein CcoG [Alphaproteobacteria bacterium]
RALKWAVMAMTLGVYYGLPWLRWDRGPGEPSQAVLVDFTGRRFYFFFIEIWPNEIYYITGLLILAALALFLVTSLFGRVWCGYACPQTVWTDLYIAVERLIEGDRNARIRLAKEGWATGKFAKKIIKHALWLLIAAATGGAWIFYFHDAPTVFPEIFIGHAPATAYVFLGILTFTTYALAGTMREQVCTYMCPWPRIQAALTDEDALSVTYRRDRGEPRGPHRKGDSWEGHGDCIDCAQCVAACPMGIDIRDGDQLECINCALCIDACNSIMKKVGRPQNLIAYDTLKNVTRRSSGQSAVYRFVRARTIFYAIGILVVAGIMLLALTHKRTIDLSVGRDRNPAFVRLSDGSVRNGYSIRVENRAPRTARFAVRVESKISFEMKAVGIVPETGPIEFPLKSGEDRTLRVYLTQKAGPAAQAAPLPLEIEVINLGTGEERSEKTTFLSGAQP